MFDIFRGFLNFSANQRANNSSARDNFDVSASQTNLFLIGQAMRKKTTRCQNLQATVFVCHGMRVSRYACHNMRVSRYACVTVRVCHRMHVSRYACVTVCVCHGMRVTVCVYHCTVLKQTWFGLPGLVNQSLLDSL